MEKVAGAKANPTLLALWYSQSKMLKTTTLLLAPKEFRPMGVLDCDGGAKLRLRALMMSPEQRKALRMPHSFIYDIAEEMKAAGCPPDKDIDFFYPSKTNYYGDCMEFAMKEARKYKLAAIDTLTSMSSDLIGEVKVTNYGGEKRFTVTTGEHTTVSPNRSDYGLTHDRIMEIIKAMDDGPNHTLLLTHEKTGQIEDAESVKRIIAGPRTIGNALLELLPSMIDVVLRFDVKSERVGNKLENKIVVRTQRHHIYLAGDRSGLFTDYEELDPRSVWERFGVMTAPQAQEGVRA